MPELPEVQTIASDLDEVVRGRTITQAAVSFPKIVAGDEVMFVDLLTGAKTLGVERFGKWIRFNLDGPTGAAAMLVHLKMTGQFHLGPWPEGKDGWVKHDHAAFRLSGLPAGEDALIYRDMRKFGRLRVFDRNDLTEFVAELGLGPDPLLVKSAEFHQRLTARKGKLKSVLLDQTVVAGLGNIYVDESLFAARLSPLASPAALTREETDRLLKEAKRILKASIAARGSTTSNYQGLKGGGSFQKTHNVYHRAGEPCPSCGAAIERLVLGGRATHYCARCQPGEKK